MLSKDQFIQTYSKVTALTWANDDYLNRLVKEPRAVLAEAGFETPKDAVVKVETIANSDERTGTGSIEGQYERWLEGQRTGVYNFVIGLRPKGWEPGNISLSDMQLEVVAGGIEGQLTTDISISCCCCTPCTCCT